MDLEAKIRAARARSGTAEPKPPSILSIAP